VVADETGSVVPNVEVALANEATGQTRAVTSDDKGRFTIPSVPPGSYTLTAHLQGFKHWKTTHLRVGHGDALAVAVKLVVGDKVETITVVADRDLIETSSGARGALITPDGIEAGTAGTSGGGEGLSLKFWKWGRKERLAEPSSSNVAILQQRAQGILPVRVDVPRTGRSLNFVRPLVLDEETSLTLRYKRRKKR
jgi:hypothetical protein